MHSHHPHQQLLAPFLRHLGSEEALLRDALAGATEVHAALRRGDLAGALAATARQAATGTALGDAAAVRTASATALARELGISADAPTLAALAAKLPDPLAVVVRAARDRLAAVAADLTAVQARNANLVGHLRSFFRGVLSELTAPGAPLRYGPSGGRLEPATGAAVQARG